MQLFRVGGQRACGRRQNFYGVVCNGRADAHEDAAAKSPSGHFEFLSQWKSIDGNNLPTSASKTSTACSPLQFILDDLASPSVQPAGAFRRVVCVPFQPSAGSVRAALERKVRELLLDNHARPRCADLQSMASVLMQQGLQTAIMHPRKPHARTSFFARSISAPYLVVTSDETEEVVVVDGALREHLLVAPSTPAYQRTLAAAIPDLFIGCLVRLHQLVISMASAISLNFTSQGIDVPPWRRTSALLARWAFVKGHRTGVDLNRLQQQHFRKEQIQSSGRQRGELMNASHDLPLESSECCGKPTACRFTSQAGEMQPPAPQNVAAVIETMSESCAGDHDAQVRLEGQVHGCDNTQAHHDPILVVRGFDVDVSGKVLARAIHERSDAWPSIRPGGLASLCRKHSENAPGSSTESDSAWGASPSSVFRSK
ncbi:hypothetical protein Vretimale_4384 [Volvox reticuliferus]|uniref:Uncharacterized protein n=1 Tax=Volvox reticuliferus TaxID=1737510 RepID=A0A8J4C6F8_9CHLO|nr:hypothetical protein Vretifemale_2971 [Volvox reticuliferus]GIL99118.1 hypothetical protein Vretimale_4384 [Volvox reticuliferus]